MKRFLSFILLFVLCFALVGCNGNQGGGNIKDVEIPEDGTWVDIVGIVGPDSTKNLSGIRYAEMTLMDEPGNEYVE